MGVSDVACFLKKYKHHRSMSLLFIFSCILTDVRKADAVCQCSPYYTMHLISFINNICQNVFTNQPGRPVAKSTQTIVNINRPKQAMVTDAS